MCVEAFPEDDAKTWLYYRASQRTCTVAEQLDLEEIKYKTPMGGRKKKPTSESYLKLNILFRHTLGLLKSGPSDTAAALVSSKRPEKLIANMTPPNSHTNHLKKKYLYNQYLSIFPR